MERKRVETDRTSIDRLETGVCGGETIGSSPERASAARLGRTVGKLVAQGTWL